MATDHEDFTSSGIQAVFRFRQIWGQLRVGCMVTTHIFLIVETANAMVWSVVYSRRRKSLGDS